MASTGAQAAQTTLADPLEAKDAASAGEPTGLHPGAVSLPPAQLARTYAVAPRREHSCLQRRWACAPARDPLDARQVQHFLTERGLCVRGA